MIRHEGTDRTQSLFLAGKLKRLCGVACSFISVISQHFFSISASRLLLLIPNRPHAV